MASGDNQKVAIDLATGLEARQLDDRQLTGSARLAAATPLWKWIGEGATGFSS